MNQIAAKFSDIEIEGFVIPVFTFDGKLMVKLSDVNNYCTDKNIKQQFIHISKKYLDLYDERYSILMQTSSMGTLVRSQRLLTIDGVNCIAEKSGSLQMKELRDVLADIHTESGDPIIEPDVRPFIDDQPPEKNPCDFDMGLFSHMLSEFLNAFAAQIEKSVANQIELSMQRVENSFLYISKVIESPQFISQMSQASTIIEAAPKVDMFPETTQKLWVDKVYIIASSIRALAPETYPRVKSVYKSVIGEMNRVYGFVLDQLKKEYVMKYMTDDIPSNIELIADDAGWSELFMNLLTDRYSEISEGKGGRQDTTPSMTEP